MAQQPIPQNASEHNQPIMEEHKHPVLQNSGKKRKCTLCARCFLRTHKKGDRSFIEGCLFALCCCWLCDACFDVNVVVG